MKPLKIGIVGPCGAGKTTLIAGLAAHGYDAHHIAQEHSYVPTMWEKITHPDLLIYLDVSYTQSLQRRRMDWSEAEYRIQLERLSHARQHANLYIDTTSLSIPDVLAITVNYLSKLSDQPPHARPISPENPPSTP
jgi:deoxyadenosine/deoxycytidine kinase